MSWAQVANLRHIQCWCVLCSAQAKLGGTAGGERLHTSCPNQNKFLPPIMVPQNTQGCAGDAQAATTDTPAHLGR